MEIYAFFPARGYANDSREHEAASLEETIWIASDHSSELLLILYCQNCSCSVVFTSTRQDVHRQNETIPHMTTRSLPFASVSVMCTSGWLGSCLVFGL